MRQEMGAWGVCVWGVRGFVVCECTRARVACAGAGACMYVREREKESLARRRGRMDRSRIQGRPCDMSQRERESSELEHAIAD